MFKSILLSSAVLFAGLYPHQEAQAQVRCPAGYGSCTYESAGAYIQEQWNQAAYNVTRNPYGNGRWNEVRKALNNCIKCGANVIDNGYRRLTDPRIGGNAPRRSGRGAR
jgi:hypothetical protein